MSQNLGIKLLQQRVKDDPGIEKFLDYFYKFCIDVLFRTVHDVPEYKDISGALYSSFVLYRLEVLIATQIPVWSLLEKRRTSCYTCATSSRTSHCNTPSAVTSSSSPPTLPPALRAFSAPRTSIYV